MLIVLMGILPSPTHKPGWSGQTHAYVKVQNGTDEDTDLGSWVDAPDPDSLPSLHYWTWVAVESGSLGVAYGKAYIEDECNIPIAYTYASVYCNGACGPDSTEYWGVEQEFDDAEQIRANVWGKVEEGGCYEGSEDEARAKFE